MAWWRSLAPRERLFLGVGAFIVIMLGLYIGIGQPLEASIAQTKNRLQVSITELKKLKTVAAEYNELGGSKKKISTQKGSSLLAVIDTSSKKFALKESIKRITPEGKSKVRVQLQEARFDKLIGWLTSLAKNRGIHAQSITLRKSDKPGLVSVNVELKQG